MYRVVNRNSRSTRSTWLSTQSAGQQGLHGYQHRQQVNKGYKAINTDSRSTKSTKLSTQQDNKGYMATNTAGQQGLHCYQHSQQVNKGYKAISTDSRSARDIWLPTQIAGQPGIHSCQHMFSQHQHVKCFVILKSAHTKWPDCGAFLSSHVLRHRPRLVQLRICKM